MLYKRQPKSNQTTYIQMLQSTGALSNLFSESTAPYLVSRNVENTYCEAFQADNLGRSDCSADAALDGVGIGLKTFLHGNGRTLQKVAEFNKDSELYRGKSPREMIEIVAQLRNNRIEFTKRTYGLHDMIYHCVTRKPKNISLFEVPMSLIDIKRIRNINVNNKNIITFEDGLNEYSFNITKSTLYKRFYMENPLDEINVQIIENPYTALAQLFNLNTENMKNRILASPINTSKDREYIILPLFSDRGTKRHVPEKSGLNQWNAAGRLRNPNEVYIPIPIWIHKVFPTFFPARDESFDLCLPDKKNLSAKVCQENSKALMSNPNSALGEWLLRQVMDLRERELLTYEKLEILGIDSVIVYKHSETDYSIDFCEIGTYDEFVGEYNN